MMSTSFIRYCRSSNSCFNISYFSCFHFSRGSPPSWHTRALFQPTTNVRDLRIPEGARDVHTLYVTTTVSRVCSSLSLEQRIRAEWHFFTSLSFPPCRVKPNHSKILGSNLWYRMDISCLITSKFEILITRRPGLEIKLKGKIPCLFCFLSPGVILTVGQLWGRLTCTIAAKWNARKFSTLVRSVAFCLDPLGVSQWVIIRIRFQIGPLNNFEFHTTWRYDVFSQCPHVRKISYQFWRTLLTSL